MSDSTTIVEARWYTVTDLADRLGISRAAIYRAIRLGRLRAVGITERRDLRIAEPWVREWIDARSITVNRSKLGKAV